MLVAGIPVQSSMTCAICSSVKRICLASPSSSERRAESFNSSARILAISKCDIADPEIDLDKLTKDLSEELEIPVITFSSASGMGITELKDMLWEELNKEQNQVIDISHAPIEVKLIERDEEPEEDDDEPHTIYLNEVEEEWDLDKYRGIGWDTQDNFEE
jgi:50S ribosomal subunit-associated GTPase HflX